MMGGAASSTPSAIAWRGQRRLFASGAAGTTEVGARAWSDASHDEPRCGRGGERRCSSAGW
jgi:hypothetical protein